VDTVVFFEIKKLRMETVGSFEMKNTSNGDSRFLGNEKIKNGDSKILPN
jgi:hypothetical protein